MAVVKPRTVELTVTLPDCAVPLSEFRRMKALRLLGPDAEMRFCIGTLMVSEAPSAPKQKRGGR